MRLSPILIVLLVAIATFPQAGCGSSKSKPENFSAVADDDPEMLAAIARARKSLPEFWTKLERPSNGEGDFSLKVRIKDEHGTEHFWVTNLNRRNGTITGVINNDPEIVHSVKIGQQITVPESDISDWMYLRNGKIYGNETVHALYKTMSPEELAQIKKLLANP
jgi:uncharacterized protein YegJ (DUF2314 family)